MATPYVPLTDATVAPPAPPPQAGEPGILDTSFDALFGVPGAVPQVPPSAPATPTAPPQPEWFLESPTGTRYRTAEEAQRGVAEKDTLIQQLRAQLQAPTPPQAPAAPPRQAWQPQAPTALDVLNQSVAQTNPQLYQQYLQSMIQEEAVKVAQQMFQSQMAPIQPLISYSNMNRAVEEAARTEPNIPAFVRSDAFKQVAQRYDIVGDAIVQARENPAMYAGQLPKIIHLAYKLAQGDAYAQSQLAPATGRTTPSPTSTPPLATGQPQAGNTPAQPGTSVLDLPLEDILLGKL